MTTETTNTKTSPISISPVGVIAVELTGRAMRKYNGCGSAFAAITEAGVVNIEYIRRAGQEPSARLAAMGRVVRGMLSCGQFCIG